jgi:hypothetical protein
MTMILMNLGGCESKHYVDVYVASDCQLYLMDRAAPLDPLMVFPGDYVIFNNMTDAEVKLDPYDGIFDKDEATIAPFKRVTLKVIHPGDLKDKNIVITCTGGSTGPKVHVGEDP